MIADGFFKQKTKILIFVCLIIFSAVPFVSSQECHYTIYGGTAGVYPGYKGDDSYFNIELKDVMVNGFLPLEDEYEGWCVDTGHMIRPNTWYDNSKLYCSILAGKDDPSIPTCIRESMDWNRTNYILTQWYKPDQEKIEPYKSSSYGDIQQVLWHFGDDGYDYREPVPSSPDFNEGNIEAIIADAMDNGENFVPSECDTIALIIDPHKVVEDPCRYQLIIIGIQSCTQIQMAAPRLVIPEFPLGTIAALATSLTALALTTYKRRKGIIQ